MSFTRELGTRLALDGNFDTLEEFQDHYGDSAATCWFVVIGSGTTRGREAAGLLYRSQSSTDVRSPWTFVDVLIHEGAGRAQEQYQVGAALVFRDVELGTM